MPISLPYKFQNLDVSQLDDAVDNSGDVIGKAFPVNYLDANFEQLAKIITVSSTAPTSPYTGQLWLDTSTTPPALKIYDGSAWIGVVKLKLDASPELGGELNAGANSIGFTAQTATGDGTTTIDWKKGNKFHFTFGAQDETFTFTAPSYQCNLLLKITQDSTGGRDATFPSSVKWLGLAPNIKLGGANKTMIITFYFDGSTYWGQSSAWEV